MSKETRDRIAFRMQPETRRRIEQWYAADNCQSKNEFIEKAVNFYVDYLGIQDNTTLLSMAIMSAIDGRLSRLEDYIARRDFTRCVEQDMTNGIIAEAFEMDRDDLKRRRAQSVRNVRATNGTISLEKYARSRQEPDWDDDEFGRIAARRSITRATTPQRSGAACGLRLTASPTSATTPPRAMRGSSSTTSSRPSVRSSLSSSRPSTSSECITT